MISTSDTPTR